MIPGKLAHYELLEKLGEGGMGVVYKARDTHLDRFVAIKVLSPARVADAARKARFVQEAKAASALNHPNIVHIYDIAESGGTDYIAMEFVAGKTLDQLIPHKGMRLNEALKCAVQMCDGLATAHAVGIVHRDVKPGNVMVTGSGLVKLLDFGLAKLTETEVSEDTPTRTARPLTAEGTIVGTAAYMSPEQAEGKKLDARSDVFSFGAVLYEMASGHRAFEGDGLVPTLAAVMRQEPKALPESVPQELQRIIARCLRKDPARRFYHMEDLRVALEELKEESESGALAAGVGSPVRKGRRWLVAAAVACAMLALAGVLWLRWSKPPAPSAEVKETPLTADPGMEMQPTFSPDATQVAYVWDGEGGGGFDLYIKQVGSEDRRRLTTDPADEGSPAWSPDGRWIAFLRPAAVDKTKLMLISPLGARELVLAEGQFPRKGDYIEYNSPHLAWAPDSASLAAVTRLSAAEKWSIHTLSVQAREWRKLTTPPASAYADVSPAFSPDGRKLAFVRLQSSSTGDLYVLDLASDLRPAGEPRRLTKGGSFTACPVWTPGGAETLFLSGGTFEDAALWRVPSDGSAAPSRVTAVPEGIGQLSLSRSGKQLVFQRVAYDYNLWRLPLAGPGKRTGDPIPLPATTRTESYPSYSPDGARISFTSSRTGKFELYVADREGKGAQPLTNLRAGFMGVNRWSPDGKRIVFVANLEGHRDLFVVDADGGGQPRPLASHPSDDITPAWALDGTQVYFCSNRGGDFQLWKVPVEGGQPVQLTTVGAAGSMLSPDGKYVYFAKTRGASSLWRIPAGGGAPEFVFGPFLSFGWQVVADGLYFIRPDASDWKLMFLHFRTGGKTDLLLSGIFERSSVAVSPDGRSLIFSKADRRESDLILVENFR